MGQEDGRGALTDFPRGGKHVFGQNMRHVFAAVNQT